jgi:hypothetical protein
MRYLNLVLLACIQGGQADTTRPSTPTSSPAEPHKGFSWTNTITLKVKNQFLTSSCLSHAITTTVEAYFKIHKIHDGAWSALDLYYCGLTKESRFIDFYALSDMERDGIEIMSSTCAHTKMLNVLQKLPCAQRDSCKEPRAVIKKFKRLLYPTKTSDVQKALREYGPLIVGVYFTSGMGAYSRQVQKKQGKRIYQAQDWDKGRQPTDDDAHAVVMLGWDYDSTGRLYWILQNSHGNSSGDNGLVYVYEKEGHLFKLGFFAIVEASLSQPPVKKKEPAKQ